MIEFSLDIMGIKILNRFYMHREVVFGEQYEFNTKSDDVNYDKVYLVTYSFNLTFWK